MENTPQQTSEGTAVVRVLATVLERLVKANADLSISGQITVTKFHALKAPGISILQYLERIYKYASCSTECFILALIYIDRLIQKHNFLLTELNVHRVVITSVLLAAKFFDDAYYNNAYYAKVGGVLVSEMNGLEVEFLFRINFSLHVKPEEFAKYQAELVSHAVGPDPERAMVCTQETQPPAAPAEISQPPSPRPMSSQSTSPSLSPQNDCAYDAVAYPYNHTRPDTQWANGRVPIVRPPDLQQHPWPHQTMVPTTPTLHQANVAFCAQSQLIPPPPSQSPDQNPTCSFSQAAALADQIKQATSTHNQTGMTICSQSQVTPPPPNVLRNYAQMNISLSRVKAPITDVVIGGSLRHVSPAERQAPYLPRHNSYPYSVHSKTQDTSAHGGNIAIYHTTTTATENNQTSNVSLSCSHYGRHDIHLGFVTESLPQNVADIM